MNTRLALMIGFTAALAGAAAAQSLVLDRIAVTVGNDVITEREVLRQIRMAAFLNGEPYNYSPASKRSAAQQLVEQDLIRHEMKISRYPEPHPADAAKVLTQLKREHFGGSDPAFRSALGKYGLTQAEVEAQMRWQLAVLQFTDYRFRPGIPQAPAAANAANTAAEREPAVDQALDAWLRQARTQTRIRYREEAFQ